MGVGALGEGFVDGVADGRYDDGDEVHYYHKTDAATQRHKEPGDTAHGLGGAWVDERHDQRLTEEYQHDRHEGHDDDINGEDADDPFDELHRPLFFVG